MVGQEIKFFTLYHQLLYLTEKTSNLHFVPGHFYYIKNCIEEPSKNS